jgi:peroxiredoxin
MNKVFRALLILAIGMVFAACTWFDEDEVSSVQNDPPTEEVAVETVSRPEWQFIELIDVNTGETFTLADFEGQTVFVETMATWCSNCRSQLRNVRSSLELVDEDANYVFIALSLETNLTDSDLADYTENEGFSWVFAVMSDEMLRNLADEFGRSVANAPSTPHFIIRPDGTLTELVTGVESAEEIARQMAEADGV